jgi:hypothetical protein
MAFEFELDYPTKQTTTIKTKPKESEQSKHHGINFGHEDKTELFCHTSGTLSVDKNRNIAKSCRRAEILDFLQV